MPICYPSKVPLISKISVYYGKIAVAAPVYVHCSIPLFRSRSNAINSADNFSVVLLKTTPPTHTKVINHIMHDISGNERRNVLVQTTPSFEKCHSREFSSRIGVGLKTRLM